jgi:hypothetical protein
MKRVLATIMLVFGLALAPMPASAQPMDQQQLKVMLENMGYETMPRASGSPGYVIQLKWGTGRIMVEVYHRPDRVGLLVDVGKLSDDPATLQAALSANRRFTYGYVQLDQTGYLQLVMPIPSNGLTPSLMKARIEEFEADIAIISSIFDFSREPLRALQ